MQLIDWKSCGILMTLYLLALSGFFLNLRGGGVSYQVLGWGKVHECVNLVPLPCTVYLSL